MFAKEYKNKNSEYTMPDNSDFLRNLKKINIFVGANNSGKSRFLRSIFRSNENSFVFFDHYNDILKGIYDRLFDRFYDYYYMKDLKNLMNSPCGNYSGSFNIFYNKIDSKEERSEGTRHESGGSIWDLDVANAIKIAMKDKGIYNEIDDDFKANLHIYIPMLRGLRHIDIEKNGDDYRDYYQEKTLKDYDMSQLQTGFEVFSGLSVYKDIKKMLLGSRTDRNLITQFEEFLANNFFNGKKITLVSDYSSDNVKINIDDNNKDREICNVGDGIQSMIINTFQVFKNKDKDLILFIEEPELTMHPYAQRVLIETFIKKFPNAQLFLTTHSNHFLNLTYDYPDEVSIFSFEEVDKEKFMVKDQTNKSKILDLLGVRNSSVFLSNSVIWTEGVTDRMLLRKLIEIKDDFNYVEDYHYTFAEYGGGNLENFDFIEDDRSNDVNVQSISKTNYIVIDNDGLFDEQLKKVQKSKKYLRRKKIKSLLGNEFVFDYHIEIENLVPFKVWSKVIDKIFIKHPNMKIKKQDKIEKFEKLFNNKLNKDKIGVLLKKYLIEKKDNEDLKYFNNNSIQCLGLTKKEIMEIICEVIDEDNMKLFQFPEITQNIVKSIEKFIADSN